MSIQGTQQENFRTISSTTGSYNEDSMAAFRSDLSITTGTYNECKLLWLQLKLTSTTDNLMDIQNEAAEDRGVSKWQEIEAVGDIGT